MKYNIFNSPFYLVDKFDTYAPIWEDTTQTGVDDLTRYRAADIIDLFKETGYIDRVDYRLVLRTLDHIEVGVEGGLEIVFLRG